MEKITENYQLVVDHIRSAARSAGRDPDEVRLVVVTKGHPLDSVRQVVQAGASRLGENYVEDAIPKIEGLEASIEWHMIGHIQSRKSKNVCEYFDWVHSLDRLKVARKLDRFAGEQGKILPVLLEFNVSGEDSKYGWYAGEEARWSTLNETVRKIVDLPNLWVLGLMTMAPYFEDAELARPYFQKLRRLRDYFAVEFPNTDWRELSMGMSGDFQVAIQEGATLVRIGTAIMGERPD